jgi:protein-disulfide isomerase
MSSRAEQKRELREAREAREREAAAADQRRRRLILLGASVLAALAIVGILIAVSQSGGDDESGLGGGESLAGAADVRQLYRGIPQSGATLGDPQAPVRMVEYADLQCPVCARFAESVLPTLVQRYVRSGRLRLELRPIAILGDDSRTAAGAAGAAAQENRAWQFTDLAYLNQGQENSGYVTDDFLRRVAAGAGLAPGPIVTASQTPDSVPLFRQSTAEAQRLGINATPTFLIGRRGGGLRPLQVSAIETDQFTAAIDRTLGG